MDTQLLKHYITKIIQWIELCMHELLCPAYHLPPLLTISKEKNHALLLLGSEVSDNAIAIFHRHCGIIMKNRFGI